MIIIRKCHRPLYQVASKREFYTQAAKMAGMPLPDFADSDDRSFKIIDNRKLKRVLENSIKVDEGIKK